MKAKLPERQSEGVMRHR